MAIFRKQVSLGKWLKKGEDYKDRDILTIGNEGKQVEGTYGMQTVFLVKTPSGAEGNFSMNQTSLNNMIDAYGEDSITWVGKKARVWLILQSVSGKMQKVPYLAHPEASIEETGNGFEFVIKNTGTGSAPKKDAPAIMTGGTITLTDRVEYPTESINPDDIPF